MKKAEFPKWICLGLVLSLVVITSLIGCAQGSTTPSSSPATSPASPQAAQKSVIAKASGPSYGGVMRVGDQYDGLSVGYPPKLTTVTSAKIASPAIERLLQFDKAGEPAPWLASGFTVDAAAKTITLTLRKGVKFHDGTDFNAEAAKWNLEQSKSAKSAAAEKIKSVDVLDDLTVRVNLTEWDSTIISNFASVLGMMISPTAFSKNGEEWAAKNPVGTGPFEFVSWQKDTRHTYKKFNAYWQQGKPYLDGLEYNIIADATTREMSFLAGELDLLMTRDAMNIAGLEKNGYAVTRSRKGTGAQALVPDSADPNSPWADLRVRQAAQYAIDKEVIVKSVLYGEAEVANQFIYTGHWAFNPSVVGYSYDPGKSKQLLAEAGYPNGFKTTLSYPTGPEADLFVNAVQGYFSAVGINAELDIMQMARWNQVRDGGKWDGLFYTTPSSNPDPVVSLAAWYSGGRFFSEMLAPQDYKNAIQNAVVAPDLATKKKWVQEVMKLMTDKYSLRIELYNGYEFGVTPKSVHDHGLFVSPDPGLWLPAGAWISK